MTSAFHFLYLQANHFLDQSKQPQIATLTLRRLIGPAGEPSIHIDLTIAVRNRTEVRIESSHLFIIVENFSLAT